MERKDKHLQGQLLNFPNSCKNGETFLIVFMQDRPGWVGVKSLIWWQRHRYTSPSTHTNTYIYIYLSKTRPYVQPLLILSRHFILALARICGSQVVVGEDGLQAPRLNYIYVWSYDYQNVWSLWKIFSSACLFGKYLNGFGLFFVLGIFVFFLLVFLTFLYQPFLIFAIIVYGSTLWYSYTEQNVQTVYR